MNMPSIPVTSPLGYIGVFFVIAGFFLVIAGIELIKIEKLTITPGRKTWGFGLLLAALGLLFLLPEIIPPPIPSPPVPTAVDTFAPNLTPTSPVPTSTSATIVQPTPTPIIDIPLTLTAAPLFVACITSRTGTGAPAEVQADSLMFNRLSGPYPAPKLPLADGAEILFSNMRSLEVIEVSENPFRVRVTIALLNGKTVTDDVRDADSYWDRLTGIANYGSFSIDLSDVWRVEFQQGGCQ
jgi:hypothetical protein